MANLLDFSFQRNAALINVILFRCFTTRNISWIPLYQSFLRIRRLATIWRLIRVWKFVRFQLSSCATTCSKLISRNWLKELMLLAKTRVTRRRQRESGIFAIRIDTCNREPTDRESFACTDLLNTDRCAEFRDSALRASANPAWCIAPPGSRQTARRPARIKSPLQDLRSLFISQKQAW